VKALLVAKALLEFLQAFSTEKLDTCFMDPRFQALWIDNTTSWF
jgi:hypothetical protein